ncbi:MAG: SDR family NAD(P)-dependent oxidoreductase [Bacteroidia bacterium]|nr:SDR family NAD(P)-dependent oxidoreductase [Bacteroidia bacterium]
MYSLSNKFPQKRAFITGAASGLGRALSLELAADGWNLGLIDIDEKGLTETVEMVKQKGGKVASWKLDVSNREQYHQVAADFLVQFGGIDLLINNAGVGDGGLLGEYPLENWDWILSINLMGVIQGCHIFHPAMKASGSGQIINISSAAAFGSAASMGPYNVAKAGVLSLSETLRAELAPQGIGVSVVMPTFFQTNIMQHSRTKGVVTQTGEKMMTISGLSATKVAREILQKSGKGKFYIILPAQARWFWRIKRLAPNLFLKITTHIHKNREKSEARVERMYQKALKKGTSKKL